MAHVYHWKHGWIPLDHTAALSKAKGNHDRAATLLAAAHGPHAGIHSRQDVAKAIRDLPNVPSSDRNQARQHIVEAAGQHGAEDLLPQGLQSHRAEREAKARERSAAAAKAANMSPEDFRAKLHRKAENSRKWAEETGVRAPVSSFAEKQAARAEQTPREIHDRLLTDPSSVSMDELQRLSRLGGKFSAAANAEIGRRDDAEMRRKGIKGLGGPPVVPPRYMR